MDNPNGHRPGNPLNQLLSNMTADASEHPYEVAPYRLAYSMSTSEFGLIVLMLALILITLFLICIASNLKSNFKRKMGSLGVVVVNVNGKKQVCVNSHLNTVFQPPVDFRTTSFMNVQLPE